MAIDLDALMAAANQAAQACFYRLGNCSRVLHIGFFFDGVGRNIELDAPENRLSNIARLFRAYPEDEHKTDLVAYKKHYISGLGTPFIETTEERLQGMMDKSLRSLLDDLKNSPADLVKEAFKSSVGGASSKDMLTEMHNRLLTPAGQLKMLKDSVVKVGIRVGIEATPWLRDSEFMAYKFVTGADTRLNSVKARFVHSFEEAVKAGEVPVRLISVSVFGFDMGGTLARQFIDILLEEICDKKTGENPVFAASRLILCLPGCLTARGIRRRAAITGWTMGTVYWNGCQTDVLSCCSGLPRTTGVNFLRICLRYRKRSENHCTWWLLMSGGAGGACTAPGAQGLTIKRC